MILPLIIERKMRYLILILFYPSCCACIYKTHLNKHHLGRDLSGDRVSHPYAYKFVIITQQHICLLRFGRQNTLMRLMHYQNITGQLWATEYELYQMVVTESSNTSLIRENSVYSQSWKDRIQGYHNGFIIVLLLFGCDL